MNRRTLLLADGVAASSVIARSTGDSDDGNGGETDPDANENGTDGEGPDADAPQPDDDAGEGEFGDDAGRPEPERLSGTGDRTTSIGIDGGLTVVESEHGGSGRFDGRFEAPDGAVGRYVDDTGTARNAEASLLDAGTYTVEISADGGWRLE